MTMHHTLSFSHYSYLTGDAILGGDGVGVVFDLSALLGTELDESRDPLMDGMVHLSLDGGAATGPEEKNEDARGVKRQLALTSSTLLPDLGSPTCQAGTEEKQKQKSTKKKTKTKTQQKKYE